MQHLKFPTDITIAGATGLVGHELLLILSQLDQVKTIKAVTRSPLGKIPARTDNLLLNFDKIENYSEQLQASVFICCLGTTIKKAQSQENFRRVDYDYALAFAHVAEKVGAQKFLLISAMGADAHSSVFYNRVKGELERDLRKLKIPQIEIFRPSLILGDRKESRPGEVFMQKMAPYLSPLLRGPLKKYRPITATSIARAMAMAVLNFHEGQFIYESDEIQKIANQIKAE